MGPFGNCGAKSPISQLISEMTTEFPKQFKAKARRARTAPAPCPAGPGAGPGAGAARGPFRLSGCAAPSGPAAAREPPFGARATPARTPARTSQARRPPSSPVPVPNPALALAAPRRGWATCWRVLPVAGSAEAASPSARRARAAGRTPRALPTRRCTRRGLSGVDHRWGDGSSRAGGPRRATLSRRNRSPRNPATGSGWECLGGDEVRGRGRVRTCTERGLRVSL